MSKPDESYCPRKMGAGVQIDCEKLGTPLETCWGEVTMTSSGYRCRGHRSPKLYLTKPVAPTPEEIEQRKKTAEEAKAKRKAAWEACRWFRPLLDDLPLAPDPFYAGLSNPVLSAVFSMIGEGLSASDTRAVAAGVIRAMGRHVAAEVAHRGLPWPLGYYDLKLATEWDGPIGSPSLVPGYHTPFTDVELALDLSLLSDDHLHALYGCAAQVEDYSCLERGARQVADHVYQETNREGQKRGLRLLFLMDWGTDASG
jgi:hypothetical protein